MLSLFGGTEGSRAAPIAGWSDTWVARYDGAVNQAWIRQIGTAGVEYEGAAIADGSGGVFLGGATTGGLGGPPIGTGSSCDAWLAHYDGAGNQT
jgi:hypothetical protein